MKRNSKILVVGIVLSSLLLLGCSNTKVEDQKAMAVKVEKLEKQNKDMEMIIKNNSGIRMKIEKDYLKNLQILSILEEKEMAKKDITAFSSEKLYLEVQSLNNKIIKVLYEKGIVIPKNMMMEDYKDGLKIVSVIKGEEVKGKDLSNATPGETYKELQEIISQIMDGMLNEIEERLTENGIAEHRDIIVNDYMAGVQVLSSMKDEEIEAKDLSNATPGETYKELQKVMSSIIEEMYETGIREPSEAIQKDYKDGIKILSMIKGEEIEAKDLSNLTPLKAYEELQLVTTKIMEEIYKEGVLKPQAKIIEDYKAGVQVLSAIKGEEIEVKDLSNTTPEEAYEELQKVMSSIIAEMYETGIKVPSELMQKDYEDGIKVLSMIKDEEVKAKDLSNSTPEEMYKEVGKITSEIIEQIYVQGVLNPRKVILKDYEEGLEILETKGIAYEGLDNIESRSIEEIYEELQKIIAKLR